MIDQNARFEDLPVFWQERILQYRREAARYRHRLRETEAQRDEARTLLSPNK